MVVNSLVFAPFEAFSQILLPGPSHGPHTGPYDLFFQLTVHLPHIGGFGQCFSKGPFCFSVHQFDRESVGTIREIANAIVIYPVDFLLEIPTHSAEITPVGTLDYIHCPPNLTLLQNTDLPTHRKPVQYAGASERRTPWQH